jgi:hypothetical protein
MNQTGAVIINVPSEGTVLRDATVTKHLSCANIFIKKGNVYSLGLDPELVFITVNVWSGALRLIVEKISSGVPGQQDVGAGEVFNFVGKCDGYPDATGKRGYVHFHAFEDDVQGCFTVRNFDEID